MVIVTGTVHVQPEHLSQALTLCRDHVQRSRGEPGYVSHAVHQDVEDPGRLFFFEQWQDRAALAKHFVVPESGAFVVALRRFTNGSPKIAIYDAEVVAT